jgi:RHS repeat-associated protein
MQGSSTNSFADDALGERASRTAGGTTTSFRYDGGSVLLEKQGSTTTGTYTYGVGLVRKDGETPLYDGTGSARAETNSSQSVTSTLTPDAFGNAVATTGSTGSSYQYGAASGYRNDGDAGLLKVGCRYYDPQVGAFTTRDTYLDQKPYLYCEHDPVNATDPSGHFTKGQIGGTIIGVTLLIVIVALVVVAVAATTGVATTVAIVRFSERVV